MTGPGESSRLSPVVTKTLLNVLEKLAVSQGLTIGEIAVRCVLAGKVPTTPAFSREVVQAYASLEQELTRGPDCMSA